MVGMYADWFVGAVAAGCGIAALWYAASANSAIYQLPKLRWIEQRYGRNRARTVLMAIGALLVFAGVLIALGYKQNWSEAV